jgi:hypothetical protein
MDTLDTTTSDQIQPSGVVPDEAPGTAAIASTDNPRAAQAGGSAINTQLKRKISQWRRFVRECIPDWTINNDYVRGKPFETDSDSDRVAVNVDFPNVKRKRASLYSQTPKIRLTPKHPSYRPGVPVFAKKVNDTLAHAGLEDAMFEVAPDVLSLAGIAAVHIAYESRSEQRDVDMAKIRAQVIANPPQLPGAPPAPPQPEMVSLPFSTAKRFVITRISPADLIADLSFTGSNFNRGSLIGRRGRMRWAEALQEFGQTKDRPNGLVEADRVDVCGRDNRDALDRINQQDENRQNYQDTEVVMYDEVFYLRFKFDPNEPSFETIQRVVFVNGKSQAVVDERWKGQKQLPNYGLAGSCLYPIQVLTLDYISDEVIPPSLTALARPQVDELIESRTQMLMQRRFSIPWRWIDNNRIPQELITVLMRGQWQGAIPLNGSGDRAMGEVARASYPRENFEFNTIAKQDADTIYGAGGSLNGGGGGNTQIRTAAEANSVAGLMQTVAAMDRARITRFVCNIAEVTAGLVSLYGDFDDEEKQALGTLNRDLLSSYYAYNISADATVLLDSGQRYQRLAAFFNETFKTGYIDPLPVLSEMADLSGVDTEVVRAPSGTKTEPMNISFRLSGVDDLDDPRVVALLMHSGQMFTPDELEAAKQVIIQSKQLPQPPQPQAPAGPGAGDGAPGVHQPPAQMQPTGPSTGDAHPQANEAERVNKRANDGK